MGAAVKRDVHITLTPYAPGCGALPIRAERRVLSLYAVEPGQAVRALVERLERQPAALAVEVVGDCVQIVGRVSGMKAAQPLAWVGDGLTAEEARIELEAERFRRAA
jgi:hypothetical protein